MEPKVGVTELMGDLPVMERSCCSHRISLMLLMSPVIPGQKTIVLVRNSIDD